NLVVMEVDEGMVAIVQSSKHAGLTVTLLPVRHATCGNLVLNATGDYCLDMAAHIEMFHCLVFDTHKGS
ncbi:jg27719, partial [Pararge aegeria aegeria]